MTVRTLGLLFVGLLFVALFAPVSVLAADGTALPTVGVPDMLTVAGASLIVSVLVGVIINAWRPTADQKDRFGPALALIVAEVVTVGFAAIQAGDLANAVIVGILVTGGSTFVHDVGDAIATK